MYSVKKQIGDIELFILKDGQTEFGEETFSGTTSSEINSLLTLNNRKVIETNFNAFHEHIRCWITVTYFLQFYCSILSAEKVVSALASNAKCTSIGLQHTSQSSI